MPEMMMMMTTRTRTTKCSAPQAISAWQFSDIRSNARVELNFKSISKEKNKRAAQEASQIAGGNGNGRIAEAVVKFNNFRFSIYFSLATQRCGFASLLAPSTTLQVSAGCGKVNWTLIELVWIVKSVCKCVSVSLCVCAGHAPTFRIVSRCLQNVVAYFQAGSLKQVSYNDTFYDCICNCQRPLPLSSFPPPSSSLLLPLCALQLVKLTSSWWHKNNARVWTSKGRATSANCGIRRC